MKKITAAAVVVLALLAAPGSAAERRRASRPPVSDDTAAGWLLNHAYPDAEAIATAARPATMIGLGDDTHGTHEYWVTKLAMIQKLVREEDFRLIGFEGPFADFVKLDDYVLGVEGDPRGILRHHELGYWFWASEEIVTALDWIRNYNLTRGERPAVEIVGFDVTDAQGASAIVTSYLDSVDPAAAADARIAYNACLHALPPRDCPSRLQSVVDDLRIRESDLVARSSLHSYVNALHGAHIVAAGFNESASNDPGYYAWRDQNMAANALALQQRTVNGKMLLWAHHEHLGRTTTIESAKSMGKWLDDTLGASYFAVGTCTGDGSFNVVLPPAFLTVAPADFPPATTLSYESSFRSAGLPVMLIPLRGPLPDWLSSPHQLRGGTSGAPYDKLEALPQKFDAIIYIDRTTPSSSFW